MDDIKSGLNKKLKNGLTNKEYWDIINNVVTDNSVTKGEYDVGCG